MREKHKFLLGWLLTLLLINQLQLHKEYLQNHQGRVIQGPFCVSVDWQLWKPVLLSSLACTGRERGQPHQVK